MRSSSSGKVTEFIEIKDFSVVFFEVFGPFIRRKNKCQRANEEVGNCCGENRCVTTLITAAKETNDHDTLNNI